MKQRKPKVKEEKMLKEMRQRMIDDIKVNFPAFNGTLSTTLFYPKEMKLEEKEIPISDKGLKRIHSLYIRVNNSS